MKTIKIILLIILSIITLYAQEQRENYPRPLNEVEYIGTDKNEFEQYNNKSLEKPNDTINISWQKLNGPYGGIVDAIYTSGDTILVSTGMDKGVIFFSINKGLTWQRSNFKNKDRVLNIISTNYGTFLAACGTEGIYETKDLLNWTEVFASTLQPNLDIILLGRDEKGGIYFTARDIKKIYYSNDSLKTWKVDLDRDSLYIMNYMSADNGDLYAGGFNKMFVKRRDSTKWVECSPGYYKNLGYNLAQDELGNIYAGSGNRNEFFESQDSGKTWIDKNTTNFMQQFYYRDLVYNKGNLIAAGWPDPFLTGWGVAISKDKGSTWEYSNEGLLPYSYAGRLATSGEDTYLGMWGGGIYRSTNQGDDWHPWMTGLAASPITQISFDKPGNLYAAIWGNGIQRSTDQGNSWEFIGNGLGISNMYSVVVDNNGIIYAGGGDQIKEATFRSIDDGKTWQKVNDFFSFFLLLDDQDRVYSLTYGNGLHRSSDKGLTWQSLNNDVEVIATWGLAFDEAGNIYRGTYKGLIYKSTNDGINWTLMRRSPDTNTSISSIVIDNDGYIYAANVNEGILRSSDNGVTWELKNNGLNNFSIDELKITSTGMIIGTSPTEVYYSTDKGNNWINITGNMNNKEMIYIALDNNDVVYLATRDESIWKGSLPLGIEDKKDEQIITEYSLSQNYPNPFNPSTTINYALPEAGYVTLKIYNTLGEEVSELVNEYKQTGNCQVSFNAKDLSSGLYIYKLNAGGKTFSKKMMLIK